MQTIPFAISGAADLEAAAREFQSLCLTIAALRDPKNGCPWDLAQDHRSLRAYMIEEAYEASEAMAGTDKAELCAELGDVLLQVLLNAQIAFDERQFSIVEVLGGLNAKMRRRHPHVFGSPEQRQQKDLMGIRKSWQQIKAAEKSGEGPSSAKNAVKNTEKKGYFEQADVAKVYPATTQAEKIGKLAALLAFDWDGPKAALQVLVSEVKELEEALQSDEAHDRVLSELGDVYFSMAQLCRHLKAHPEVVATEGNNKFLRRFRSLERLGEAKGLKLDEASQQQLAELWQEAKQREETLSS